MALQIIRKWGDRMSNSDKRSETNTVAVQPLTASRNILVLIFITAHVCFCPILCEYASPHIRLWAWCLHSNWAWSTGHHKWEALHDFPWHAALQALCQLANGRKVGTSVKRSGSSRKGKSRVKGSGICSHLPTAAGLMPRQSIWLTNAFQQINQNLFV